jgi:hypothetical protein
MYNITQITKLFDYLLNIFPLSLDNSIPLPTLMLATWPEYLDIRILPNEMKLKVERDINEWIGINKTALNMFKKTYYDYSTELLNIIEYY